VARATARPRLPLAPAGGNLCAVGDPDQAIYGFRGSSPSYFADFEKDYAGAVVIPLVRNYRSAVPIVVAATSVIAASGRVIVRAIPKLSSVARITATTAVTPSAV